MEFNTEAKVATVVISITIIIIIVALFLTGSFPKMFNSYKKSTIAKCDKINIDSVINYKDIRCSLTDEEGKTYTLSYPEFKDDSMAIKAINSEFKNKYHIALKNIEYHEDEGLDKLKIYSVNELNYKVTAVNNYLFIIDISNTLLDNGYRYDYVYNVNIVDLNNKTRVSQYDFYRSINLTNNFSSNLKKVILDLYLTKFNYNYDYAEKRYSELDDFYENLSASNIGTYYYDASGRLSFILYIYDIKQNKKVPYFFKVNGSGEVSYSEIFSWEGRFSFFFHIIKQEGYNGRRIWY